jgi:hypothetical protein
MMNAELGIRNDEKEDVNPTTTARHFAFCILTFALLPSWTAPGLVD